MRPLEVRREAGNHFTLGTPQTIDLATLDVVLMRQDPPFDMAYITATHLLEHVHPRTLVVNDPVQVRNAPEKLFRSDEHTSELQSLMRIPYAVFCLKKKKKYLRSTIYPIAIDMESHNKKTLQQC